MIFQRTLRNILISPILYLLRNGSKLEVSRGTSQRKNRSCQDPLPTSMGSAPHSRDARQHIFACGKHACPSLCGFGRPEASGPHRSRERRGEFLMAGWSELSARQVLPAGRLPGLTELLEGPGEVVSTLRLICLMDNCSFLYVKSEGHHQLQLWIGMQAMQGLAKFIIFSSGATSEL